MYLAICYVARHMKISKYLAICLLSRYMEISMFSAICFIAGYMEISMYLALCFFKSAYTSTVFQIDKDYPNLPNVFKIGKIN